MQGLTYGSVCSGIEAATVAWGGQGAVAAWFSEIEAFPCELLRQRYPDVPNLGDMHNLPGMVRQGLVDAPDILVGGTPCQSFSIAGMRKGMECPRGQLTLKFVELLNAIDEQRVGDECVAVWENVPGVLSDKSNAFGCFLAALSCHDEPIRPNGGKWSNAGCIFGSQRSIAWRVLDAQYFGLAQRRKRLFVVASARSGYAPEKVLFEWEGVRRDIAPSRSPQQETTPLVEGSVTFNMQAIGAYGVENVASTVKSRDWTDATDLVVGALDTQCGFEKAAHQSVAAGHLVVERIKGFQQNASGELRESDVCGTLNTNSNASGRNCPMVTYALAGNTIGRKPTNGGNGDGHDSGQGVHNTLTTADLHAVAYRFINWIVRRLTPVECERLQGFPDNYTRIKFGRKGDHPDAPRYAALGNSFAVPVVAWIGSRLRLGGDL